MFNAATNSHSLPEVPTLTPTAESAAMAFLEENFPHAARKVNDIEAARMTERGKFESAIAHAADLAERGKNTKTVALQYQRELDYNQRTFSQEDIDRLITKPMAQAERDLKEAKRIRNTAKRELTTSGIELLAAINPKHHYVDARVNVTSKNPVADLAACREKIEANKKETEIVRERSHFPLADALASAERAIDRLADKGRVGFGPCYARILGISGRPEGPDLRLPVAFASASGGTTIFDGPAMLAWMFRDQLKAAARAEIEARHKPERALTNVERIQKLDALKAELMDLERREESLIELCEAAGFNIARRPDASPLAVLGLARAERPPVADESPVADDDDSTEFEEADFG